MWDKITRFATDIFSEGKESPSVAKREDEIENVMGVRPNIIDPGKTPTLVRPVAKFVSKTWGDANYANPLNNTIAIDDYQPGRRPYLEAHEAGHLSWEDASPAKLLGVSGRAVTGISDQIGNPPLLEVIGGGLLHTDAAEEDRAERLSAKYGPQLGGIPENAPVIDSDGRSRYGNRLREEGMRRINSAVEPIVGPIQSAISKVNQWNTKRRQSELQPQIRDAVLNYRRISAASHDITPEMIESSNYLDKLADEYGDGFLDFVGTIK